MSADPQKSPASMLDKINDAKKKWTANPQKSVGDILEEKIKACTSIIECDDLDRAIRLNFGCGCITRDQWVRLRLECGSKYDELSNNNPEQVIASVVARYIQNNH